MVFIELNHLVVFTSAIVGMVIGALWYGPLFGKTWMKLNKLTTKDMEKAKKKGMGKEYTVAFISAWLMSYVVAALILMTSSTGLLGGVIVGVWAWLGFIATTLLNPVLWKGSPLKLYFLDTGHYLVALAVIGAIIGVWA